MSPPPPGQRAGLELLEQIGRGSSSTVWRARATAAGGGLAAGEEVAVKVLRPELLEDPEAVERVRREGELGMRVRSPHVARILAVEVGGPGDPPAARLVMQLVHGRTLRQLVADSGAVVEDLARRIGLDTATGLAALHALGVVHRDLKPENLALTPEGRVVIVDLGLARPAGAAGRSGSGFAGSLAYAAPEVLRGEAAKPASDLYALGSILYEVATGRHPFADAGTPDDMIHAHLTREPARPSHVQPTVSPFLERLIQDLLHKEPERRPADAAAVAAALAGGEESEYWRRCEREAPVLASRRRLRSMRRFAPTPLVGRRRERAELDRLARRVAAGRGAAVQIAGPTGIGRRRLLDEAIEGWLRWRPDLVFLGGEAGDRSERRGGAPFDDMILSALLPGESRDAPHARTRLAARLHAVSGLPARDLERVADLVAGDEPRLQPETRADLLARALVDVATPRTLTVLRVDRTEALSTTGRLVVRRLLDRIEELPLLLVLVSGVGARAVRFPAQQMPLRGLERAEFVRFGTLLFARDAAPRDLLRDSHAVLGGSPGNLLEALDDLMQDGRLEGAPGRYRLAGEVTELRPSGSLLTRLRTRVAGLPAAQRFALIAAAVLGDRFPLADLAALTGQHELELLEALSLFEGRVVAVERGQVRFHHRDFRRALLRLTSEPVRRRLHRAAAWLVEDRGGPKLRVGLHLSRAGLHEAALDPLLDALEHLARGGSGRAAVRIARRVRLHLRAAPRTEARSRRRLRYLMLAGLARRNAGHEALSRRRYGQAFRLASRRGDAAAAGGALLGLAEISIDAGQTLAALHLLQRSVAVLGDADGRTAARALGMHARLLGQLGEPRAGLRLARLAMRRLPGDDAELRPSLQLDLAELEALRTHFLAALKNVDRAERRLTAAGSDGGLLRVELARGRIHAQLGAATAARQHLEAALELAVRLSDAPARARALLGLGDLADATGKPAAAALWVDALSAAGREPAARVEARLRLAARGLGSEGLEEEVARLGHPALRARWLLLALDRARHRGDRAAAARLRTELAELEEAAVIPLDLRLAALAAAGRRRRGEALLHEVAQRLSAPLRRSFLAHARRLLGL